MAKQVKEWKEIREHPNSNQACIVRYYYNVATFCPDTDEDTLVCEQQVVNTFKKGDIDLFFPIYMQFRNWIAMIPFIHAEGFWEGIKTSGVTCWAESIQAVNLLSVVTDNRLCQEGLLTPSYRNQPAFLNIHGDRMDNTSYNITVTDTSGADETDLVQPILRSVLDSGGIAWVFDMGDGCRSFCENVGDTYLDSKSFELNPFANTSNINKSGGCIRGQLAVLASPNSMLDGVHRSLLLHGVQKAWEAYREEARIDHVVQKLMAIHEDDRYRSSPGITNRLDETIEPFGKYRSRGIYGEYLSSDKPSLTDDAHFIILELGGCRTGLAC